MNAKSWTGTAVWREEGDPFPIRKAAGAAALLLDEEGGLLKAGPTFPKTLTIDVRFGWKEVERAIRDHLALEEGPLRKRNEADDWLAAFLFIVGIIVLGIIVIYLLGVL